MEVNGVNRLFGFSHSSKHIILRLAEEKRNSCKFWTTWWWV